MEHQILIVILDGDMGMAELAEKIEEMRNWPGVVGVRTIERVVQDIEEEKQKA